MGIELYQPWSLYCDYYNSPLYSEELGTPGLKKKVSQFLQFYFALYWYVLYCLSPGERTSMNHLYPENE